MNPANAVSGRRVLPYVLEHAPRGDPKAILKALDEFGWTQSWVMFIGPEKGEHLDKTVDQLGKGARILELGCVMRCLVPTVFREQVVMYRRRRGQQQSQRISVRPSHCQAPCALLAALLPVATACHHHHHHTPHNRAYCGYSALRMAMRMKPGSHLYSVEPFQEFVDIARGLLEYAGLGDRVTFLCATSTEAIAELCSGAWVSQSARQRQPVSPSVSQSVS
jgi:hypothetical protein